MTTRLVVAEDGLHVPLENLGCEPGEEVAVELGPEGLLIRTREVSEEEIRHRAMAYLLEYVGDATTVDKMRRLGARWLVPVRLSYQDRRIGQLVYNTFG